MSPVQALHHILVRCCTAGKACPDPQTAALLPAGVEGGCTADEGAVVSRVGVEVGAEARH